MSGCWSPFAPAITELVWHHGWHRAGAGR